MSTAELSQLIQMKYTCSCLQKKRVCSSVQFDEAHADIFLKWTMKSIFGQTKQYYTCFSMTSYYVLLCNASCNSQEM